MEFDTQTKMAIYRRFAERARRPSPDEVAEGVWADVQRILATYSRLGAQRVLVLESDGASIRMAPPLSGVATLHVALVAGQRYFANCAFALTPDGEATRTLRRPPPVHRS